MYLWYLVFNCSMLYHALLVALPSVPFCPDSW